MAAHTFQTAGNWRAAYVYSYTELINNIYI